METYEILKAVKSGKISVNDAKKLLSLYSIEEIEGIAKIDINRRKRRGIPEIIFAETKELDEIKKIIKRTLEKSNSVIVSRLKKTDYSKIQTFAKKLKVKVKTGKKSSTLLLFKKPIKFQGGKVGILTAGTSDIGVAEEARLVCEAMNCKCITSYDVGVAGIQRIFPILKEMVEEDVDCIIVAAGMEGALATLVSTLVDIPIIGIPTSVGYGYGEKGIAALASMLQSCSLGLSVVNIDNGIAAGGIAANIANRTIRKKE
ncbi:putative N5-carboxyaminoimidazole ribonucleotide mutase protein [Marine Group I thaumarchaeote SCGC AAA799-E16]|uniref:Putative N5-carboxyaminoimidazole ribonucleotide mutase protein n=3 Tax=Marine Group I TaxID=905826 RepID=A0A087RUN9_9ARCH|nr:putative N5-carboxyaminoimidazole ribonucleotide mutase protein [Marine Group I thaumarchaeote SCGC AAA799-E16]KFM17193.1 putative N5-carboxyaminoimidazole ribonucleotide mutase protein [Marine Group I thaumarchaeote SCGC AAA799-D11]KFM19050.1 putative N5-carboxyaminoimidazole ribonucleotide mutase protein [Marine Group I thaumarchaeote SCGC RSA3]